MRIFKMLMKRLVLYIVQNRSTFTNFNEYLEVGKNVDGCYLFCAFVFDFRLGNLGALLDLFSESVGYYYDHQLKTEENRNI